MSEATWQDTRQRFSIWTFLVVIFIVTINARFLVEIVVTFHLHKFLQTQSIHAFREKRVKQGKCMNLWTISFYNSFNSMQFTFSSKSSSFQPFKWFIRFEWIFFISFKLHFKFLCNFTFKVLLLCLFIKPCFAFNSISKQ
jgi:hypothetical protein